MQSNILHTYRAGETSLTIYGANGFPVARVTSAQVVHVLASDAKLRPVELLHLAELAENFAAYHAVAFAGQNYGERLMPIALPA